jgi:hypothetical protein
VSEYFKKFLQTHNLATRLNPVFVVLPELEGTCVRVVEFIGEHFMGEKEPLAKEMLERALECYRMGKKNRRSGEIAFMQGLFERARLLYERRYIASNERGTKSYVWIPMVDSIPAFEAQYPALEIRTIMESSPGQITPHAAAFQLAARVLPGELFCLYCEGFYDDHRIDNREVTTH